MYTFVGVAVFCSACVLGAIVGTISLKERAAPDAPAIKQEPNIVITCYGSTYDVHSISITQSNLKHLNYGTGYVEWEGADGIRHNFSGPYWLSIPKAMQTPEKE